MANQDFLWPTGGPDIRPGQPGMAIGGTTTTPFPNVGGWGGRIGSAIGIGVPVPGASLVTGAIGTGVDVTRANNQLEQLGLPRSVSFGPAALNNASFGVFGSGVRGQFDDAVTKAYPGLLAAMRPAPPVEDQSTRPASTPSLDYFGAINDYNTVGHLGEVFGSEAASRGDVDTPGNSSEFGDDHGYMYRRGGIVRDDGDARLEPVMAMLHEGEGVVRPEVMGQLGKQNFRAINRGGADMREALVRILRGDK